MEHSVANSANCIHTLPFIPVLSLSCTVLTHPGMWTGWEKGWESGSPEKKNSFFAGLMFSQISSTTCFTHTEPCQSSAQCARGDEMDQRGAGIPSVCSYHHGFWCVMPRAPDLSFQNRCHSHHFPKPQWATAASEMTSVLSSSARNLGHKILCLQITLIFSTSLNDMNLIICHIAGGFQTSFTQWRLRGESYSSGQLVSHLACKSTKSHSLGNNISEL